jgi:hypothetical protein
MELNEIYLNVSMPEIRVKIIRIEKAFIMVQRIDKGPNFGYQKRFKKGIEQEAFLTYFVPVPPLFFELE